MTSLAVIGCQPDADRAPSDRERADDGCFEASVSHDADAHEWWREFHVDADVDGVTLELDDGTHHELHEHWGSWALDGSLSTPAGTRMRLHLRGPLGRASTRWFDYLQQTPTSAECAPDEGEPAPGGQGEACVEPSFTYGNANEWWREFATPLELETVRLELEGGATHSLSRQWGKWVLGDGVHTPTGTNMRLLATTADGQGRTRWFAYRSEAPDAASCDDPSSPGGDPSEPPGPTCTDGVRNQGETGIDCGGPCEACDGGASGGLHVSGRSLLDANGDEVVLRGVEHVIRWGEYQGDVPFGDVPYEGWGEDPQGRQIDEIAATGTNAIRILGGVPEELEGLLHEAIVENKLWVSIARVDWRDQAVIDAVARYGDYVMLHAQGEVVGDDPAAWRETAINTIENMRALGYTQPLEVLANGYGQRLGTILAQGEAVFDADPLGNVVFGVQLYSELAGDIDGALQDIEAFPHPVLVGASRFQEGVDAGWGNQENTYRLVWDKTGQRGLSSFYWDWSADGNGNKMSNDETLGNLTPIGRWLVYDSPFALRTHPVKSSALQNASVD